MIEEIFEYTVKSCQFLVTERITSPSVNKPLDRSFKHLLDISLFLLYYAFSAIRLQPRDALAYKKRADVKAALGKRHEALDDYRISLDLAYDT